VIALRAGRARTDNPVDAREDRDTTAGCYHAPPAGAIVSGAALQGAEAGPADRTSR